MGGSHGGNLRSCPPRAGRQSPFVVSGGVSLKVVVGAGSASAFSIAGRYRFSEGAGQ